MGCAFKAHPMIIIVKKIINVKIINVKMIKFFTVVNVLHFVCSKNRV